MEAVFAEAMKTFAAMTAGADLLARVALAGWDLFSVRVPFPVLLAAVATLGYLVGRWKATRTEAAVLQSQHELRRARLIARELENTARSVRQNLAEHHASLSRLQERVGEMASDQREMACRELRREAEQLLAPTLRLANQIANVYDETLKQINHLMTLTDVRTDPLTGVDNRRGLHHALSVRFAMMNRYGSGFSIILLEVDYFEEFAEAHGPAEADRLVRRLAELLDERARETDIVGRYDTASFAVIMPQTDLVGAAAFGEQLRARIAQQFPVTVSGGLALAAEGDDPDSLMRRAEGALNAAKSAGGNCLWRHDGQQVESVLEEAPANR